MRLALFILLVLSACGPDKKRDPCGNDPNCEPVTIGGSMAVACKCYPYPVRQAPEDP